MLTAFDDYPIHQAGVPIAHSATSDINFYDRYFFNGYNRAGSTATPLYFGVAMGLYPNRHVSDAAFSVVRGDEQISVFASGRAPLDRSLATRVGPIHVEIVEPLRIIDVHVEAPEQGLRAELRLTSRSAAIEEPHFFQRVGTRTLFDYTRLTQFGTWNGWIEIDGERTTIDSADFCGSRDRSWGTRPVGEPAPSGAPVGEPQFFWLWAPVNFETLATHFDVNEYGDGRRWHEVGAIAADGGEAVMMRSVDYRIEWQPGTRWARSFSYDLIDWNGDVHTVTLRPHATFMMRGIGYGHPEFNHGRFIGESVVAGERMTLPVDQPCRRDTVHIQALCAAEYRRPDGSTEIGVGILEQLAIGPHPTGLTGLIDPAAG